MSPTNVKEHAHAHACTKGHHRRRKNLNKHKIRQKFGPRPPFPQQHWQQLFHALQRVSRTLHVRSPRLLDHRGTASHWLWRLLATWRGTGLVAVSSVRPHCGRPQTWQIASHFGSRVLMLVCTLFQSNYRPGSLPITPHALLASERTSGNRCTVSLCSHRSIANQKRDPRQRTLGILQQATWALLSTCAALLYSLTPPSSLPIADSSRSCTPVGFDTEETHNSQPP